MNRRHWLGVGLLALLIFTIIAPVSAQGISFVQLTLANLPWDAVPSPDGTTFYYTAIGADGAPAVFSVPAAGGDPVVLASGEPLAMPLGLDISSDGATLFIADPWTAGAAGNAIFALPSDGSAVPVVVAGTWGTAPQGVTIMGDLIYFSGVDVATGAPAIYSIPTVGLMRRRW